MRQYRVECRDVVARTSVAQGACADRIRGHHAADGCLCRGGDFDREPGPLRLERLVQGRRGDAWLDDASERADIVIEKAMQIFGEVEDQALAYRLSGPSC